MGKVIGIDLGTTNSAMAIMESGEPRIIENQEGKRTTPSVVAVNPKTKERLVGELARRQAITNHKNTVYSVKRFIGRRFSDSATTREIERVAYDVKKRGKHDISIVLDGKDHPPAEISAMVLRKLKEDAEKHLGESVKQAVITVPAYFNDSQREATKAAGKIAGLEVLRIINEPTAATLAYGLDKKDEQTIIVCDLGGGTFDVTVLQLAEGVFEVKSTSGDTHLGGDDFDLCIVDYVVSEFKKESGIDLSKDPAALQRVRVESERAKIELSSVTQTEINLPFITADASGPKHLQLNLTRAKLDDLTSTLVKRTIAPTKKALKDASITAKDIDEVVMVGGMTRMPAVLNGFKALFGKTPNTSINPDEVVALGAAIQGGVLQGDVKDVLLLDVTPLTLGIETLGGVRTPLIERNTTIPTSKTETFSTAADSQTAVEIHVVQGEREMTADNVSIGRFTLTGIMPAPRGVPKVDVSFDIDSDGILTVSAKDQATNREQHITITGRSGLSDDEIERLVKEAEEHSNEDQAQRSKVDARNSAEATAYSTEKLLKDNGDKLDESAKSGIQEKLDGVKKLLDDKQSSSEDLNTAVNELQAALQQAGSALYSEGSSGGESSQAPDDTKTDDDGDTVEGEFREV